jgi:hypothetical protein
MAAHPADRGAAGDLRPGENAGIVDIGDGTARNWPWSSRWKATTTPPISSRRKGAATGVGGILRDVFTMGARPIAAMNALSFGEKDHPKTRSLVHGVVEGIGGYGNCFGVPTIGGETRFHPAYNGNCLVNAFAAGLVEADSIFYSAASGVGMPVVYLGAKTGRDGVGGATMASRGIRRHDRGKAPHGAGRRPLHRKAPAGGLPRTDGHGRRDLDPGHGGRGPDLFGGGDGRQGRAWHPTDARPRAAARGRDDGLRDDAVGKPGTHAHGAAPREGGRGARGLREMGPRFRHRGRDHPRGSLRHCPR